MPHLLVLKAPARRRMVLACCVSDQMALRHIEVGVLVRAWHGMLAHGTRMVHGKRGHSRLHEYTQVYVLGII